MILMILVILGCFMIFKFSGLSGFNSTKQSRGITYNIIKILDGNKLNERELTKLTKRINPGPSMPFLQLQTYGRV